jgi:hypothetical protein
MESEIMTPTMDRFLHPPPSIIIIPLRLSIRLVCRCYNFSADSGPLLDWSKYQVSRN